MSQQFVENTRDEAAAAATAADEAMPGPSAQNWTTPTLKSAIEFLNEMHTTIKPIRNVKELEVGKWWEDLNTSFIALYWFLFNNKKINLCPNLPLRYELVGVDENMSNEKNMFNNRIAIVRKPALYLLDRVMDAQGEVHTYEFKLYMTSTFGSEQAFKHLKSLVGDGQREAVWMRIVGFLEGSVNGVEQSYPQFGWYEGKNPAVAATASTRTTRCISRNSSVNDENAVPSHTLTKRGKRLQN